MRNHVKAAPSIRFKGFTEDWEQRKLGELGQIMTGTTPPTNDVDNYSEDGMIWVTPTDIIKNVTTDTAKKLSKKGESAARVVPPGTILVTCIASIGKNTMVSTFVSFNQQINSLTPNSENDSYFLLTQSEIWSQKMKQIASSGTMQIVNKSEFSKLEVKVPSLEEQFKIGTFFKQIDDTIALHQRQLSNYKEMKTALLQKMFPKAGEKMPEIRFEGFTGEWEERKMGDVIVEYSDKDNSKLNPAVAVGKYGIRRREDIYKKALSKDISKNKVIRKNTLTIGMGSKQIDIGILKTDEVFSVSPAYSTFNIIDVDARYLDLFLQHENKNLSKVCMIISARQGKTVDKNLLVQYNVLLPSIPEQQKIADFLFILDGQIEAQKAAFDALNRLKQGLLQQMFV